jgi:hypothetical protein
VYSNFFDFPLPALCSENSRKRLLKRSYLQRSKSNSDHISKKKKKMTKSYDAHKEVIMLTEQCQTKSNNIYKSRRNLLYKARPHKSEQKRPPLTRTLTRLTSIKTTMITMIIMTTMIMLSTTLSMYQLEVQPEVPAP